MLFLCLLFLDKCTDRSVWRLLYLPTEIVHPAFKSDGAERHILLAAVPVAKAPEMVPGGVAVRKREHRHFRGSGIDLPASPILSAVEQRKGAEGHQQLGNDSAQGNGLVRGMESPEKVDTLFVLYEPK